MKPAKRAQKSLDDRSDYERQRRTFEGLSDIATKPASKAYRDGWDRIWGRDLTVQVPKQYATIRNGKVERGGP